MSFLNSERLLRRIDDEQLIEPFDPERVKHAAYELSMGCEVFVTSQKKTSAQKKRTLKFGEQLVIPPGQFALLITHEDVYVPPDLLGFISIKAGIKFRGLVNVSGFHVDPGFEGRLKFSVYNAGGQSIVLTCGDPTFLLWYATLNRATDDTYDGSHSQQDSITAKDVMQLQGEVTSPGALAIRIQSLENRFKVVVTTVVVLLTPILVGVLLWAVGKIGDEWLIRRKTPPQAVSGSAITAPAPAVASPTPKTDGTRRN